MCNIESIVVVAGEHIHPYLAYLLGLIDLIGRIGLYVPSWVRQFYASLFVDPHHNFIHFAFRGRDYKLTSQRVREILRLQEHLVKLHEVCYGQTEPPRRPHSGLVPLQILCDTASRSLLARAHAGTLVILLRLLEF